MYRVMYKDAYQYVADRDGVFYYVRRVPHDVRQHYASSRISFSLRTKSHQSALRAAKSVTQRLEDYSSIASSSTSEVAAGSTALPKIS